jgi:hypothetical protein
MDGLGPPRRVRRRIVVGPLAVTLGAGDIELLVGDLVRAHGVVGLVVRLRPRHRQVVVAVGERLWLGDAAAWALFARGAT